MSALNTYVIAQIFTIVTALSVAAYIFLRGRERQTAKVYAFYNLSIAIWAFSWIQMATATNDQAGNFWGRVVHIPAAFVPCFFCHFIIQLTNIGRPRFQKILKISSYSFVFLFTLLSFHPVFIRSVESVGVFRYYPMPGLIYPSFVFFFFLLTFIGMIMIILSYRVSKDQSKIQLRYVLIAYVLLFFGGSQAFLPIVFKADIPRYAFFLSSIAHIILAYAVFQHQLMETRILIRRMALIALIYVALLIVTIPVIVFIHHHVETESASLVLLLESFIIGTVLSVGPFLYARFVRNAAYFREETMSGLTHELKSPLAIIESALDAMQVQTQENDLPPAQKEYMQMMERNLSRLRTFVNDLLVVFGNKDFKAQLKLDTVEADSLVADAVQLHIDAAAKKSIPIETVVDDISVTCDSERVVQALSNILSNAIKFTEKGSVTVLVKHRTDHLRFTVKDTGMGIPPTDLPHIFERFYQGQTGLQRRGSGIGLAIAKTWVEAHGGKIWAESDGEGKGTTVVFTLPTN